jgi:hypothetical protein
MPIDIYNINNIINYKVSSDYSDSILTGKAENRSNSLLDELSPFNNYLTSFNITNNIVKNTGIMPPGVRMVNNEFVVFERQPEYKNIFIVPKMINDMGVDVNQEETFSYRIPLPWQLYIVQYSTIYDEKGNPELYPVNVRMHFMKSSLYSAEQEMFLAPLPNFYTNGNLCRPMFSSMDEIDRYDKNIGGVIAAAYDWIWNCGTNLDLTESCAQMSLQFQNEEFIDTVFSNYTSAKQFKLYDFAYYCHWNFIDNLLKCWEKIPLIDISDKLWPSNSFAMNFSQERENLVAQHLEGYLRSINAEVRYDLHYDEENGEEYQCEFDEDIPLDEQCQCLQPNSSYDMREFLTYLKYYPRRSPLTYKESLDNFIKDFSPNYMASKQHFSAPMAANKFEAIENNILYSS